MNTRIQIDRPLSAAHQRGAVTLLMAMILLVSTTLLSIYSAKTTVMEQRISANEYQAMEVDQAASAGLEYALIWLGTTGNSVTWAACGVDPACTIFPFVFDEYDNTLVGPSIDAANSDAYTLSITFFRDTTANNDVIQVASTATANHDASVTKTVRVFVRAETGPVNPAFSGVPLVIDGCLIAPGGNPSIYPTPGGIAIEGRTTNPACIAQGNFKLNNVAGIFPAGTIQYTIPVLPVDIWDYVFVKTRAEIQALAAAEELVVPALPDSLRKYVWVTDPGVFHRSIGSSTNFAVVVFSAPDCAKINGGSTIYGIVFVDSPCLSANGWGAGRIFGSAIVNGDVGTSHAMNANPEFHHDNNISTLVGQKFPTNFAPREIGTWSDF